MNKPTRTQIRLLKALQNQTAAAAREHPAPTATEATLIQRFGESRAELAAAAIAGGVPVEWVEQAQGRGSKGISWNPNLYIRRAAPVDRAELLNRLQVDQAWLAHACGIHAAYQHLAPTTRDTETSARTQRILETLWQRCSQVAALLDVQPEEATPWRGQDWLATAEAAATGLTPAELERQWREIAGTDIDGYATQSIALTGVGIEPDPTLSPPPPAEAVEVLAQRRDHLQVVFSDHPGHQIDAAVTATGSPTSDPEHEPAPQPPEFSHAPERHLPGIEP